ncbi:hypothetical protein [Rhizobium sp. BK251]|nr:hypothetical protein [Rhizobium sp. BK251]
MSTPVFDLLIRNARLEAVEDLVDIAVQGERIALIGHGLRCGAI